jgi:two-component system, OmpR family, phosphate regulon sensor histidine kinase PhoR
MITLLIAGLAIALLLCLRLLAKQNRLLAELREAVRSGQPLLQEEAASRALPAWAGLAEAVNTLIAGHNTLRRQGSDQLAHLEATLGNLREAVLLVDERNVIHLANRALRDIFPRAPELVNVRLELIVRQADFLDFVRAARAGQSLPRQEFELVEGDTSTWIEVSGAPVPSPDGKAQWALFVIHDMTQQRVLERMRRDFVANASHELRTPLAVIKGYVETLVDGHAAMPVEDREKFLRTIQRHSERLNAIIADLLALSRLESATPGLQFAPLEPGPFLAGLLPDFAERARRGGQILECETAEGLGVIEADAEKLTQVVSNLLENALKYTPSGARISILARPVAGAEEVEFVVRDDGPGIPEADLPHIFERFYRVEKGRARDSGGTGLGLSIVKHTVQLHGGRVWAESGAGRGTAVFVRLPRRRKAVERSAG